MQSRVPGRILTMKSRSRRFRNNKNASGEDYVKAIARKAKKAFWLNTEEVDKWNYGDSIMGVYAKYMTKVAQTVTPAELLGFLEM